MHVCIAISLENDVVKPWISLFHTDTRKKNLHTHINRTHDECMLCAVQNSHICSCCCHDRYCCCCCCRRRCSGICRWEPSMDICLPYTIHVQCRMHTNAHSSTYAACEQLLPIHFVGCQLFRELLSKEPVRNHFIHMSWISRILIHFIVLSFLLFTLWILEKKIEFSYWWEKSVRRNPVVLTIILFFSVDFCSEWDEKQWFLIIWSWISNQLC